jgi:hypothetical protein
MIHRSREPLSGSTVKSTPATSAGTSSWMRTATCVSPVMPMRARYRRADSARVPRQAAFVRIKNERCELERASLPVFEALVLKEQAGIHS